MIKNNSTEISWNPSLSLMDKVASFSKHIFISICFSDSLRADIGYAKEQW